MWSGGATRWDSEDFEVSVSFVNCVTPRCFKDYSDFENSEDSHGHEMRRGIAHVRHHFVYRLLSFVLSTNNCEGL